MTRTARFNRQRPRNVFDRFYHSFSAESWLIVASAIIIFDWYLHPANGTAALLMLAVVGLAGFAVYFTNPSIGETVNEFFHKYGKNGTWLMFVGLLVGITVFNYATSPSSAIILTNSGVATLTAIISGNVGAVTAGGAATAGGGVGGAAPAGATAIINNIIILFRVLFFLGFMWALYRAYEKYTQQAELLDVIQTPVILLVVVGIIDGAAALFLGP
ncbi:hypothetical protein [Chamaesiphon sp.]|uniref:hypothetical protein n=1 Tax=Chamaesiphon sp. TaxID=2814140 RepID=UPI0035947676